MSNNALDWEMGLRLVVIIIGFCINFAFSKNLFVLKNS